MLKPRSLSLRTLLLGPLLLQMVVMVAVIALVRFQGGQQEITRLTTRSQELASRQVRDYLARFLSTPQQVIRLMADAVASGRIDPTDRAEVTRTLWMLHRTFPEAAYLNYGWTNGDFIGLGQVDNTSRRPFLELAMAPTVTRLELIRLDRAGRPAGLQRLKPFGDFRRDGWYHAPLQAGRAVWTPIYNWVDAPEVMALGAGIPVQRDGRLVGVAGVDTFLANIGRYLRQLPVADSGVVYIVEEDGRLVADSSGRLPFSIVNGRGVRHRAQESRDPMIRDSARALLERRGSFQALDRPAQLELPLTGGPKALVRVDPYRDHQGLDWRIVVVIPEREIYGDLIEQTTRDVLVTVVAILLSGLLTLLVVEFVIRELNSVVASTDAIAEGDLSQAVAQGSIQEISRLAHSFNEMAIRLRRSFATLRQRNREIARLADQRREQLASREEQLHQEVMQRQRLEESLAEAASGHAVPGLADPTTGLFSREGLERWLRSRSGLDHEAAEPLLALQFAVVGPGDEPLDAVHLQRMAGWLEQQAAARRHGVAAHLGAGRFALLLRGVEPTALEQPLASLRELLRPLRLWSGSARLAAGGDAPARLALLERAGLALAEAMDADPDADQDAAVTPQP